MVKQPAVYLLSSKRNGTLYVGVTSDLVKRVWEHRNSLVDGFTKRYAIHSLVFFELHGEMHQAIQREKQIKKWNRAWKIELIEKANPQWRDLWPSLVGTHNPDVIANPRDPAGCHAREREHLGPGESMDSRVRGNDGDEGKP